MALLLRERGVSDLEALVAGLPDVVFRLDRHLRHLFISPVIEKWTGIRADRFLGRTGREMGVSPPASDVFEAAATRALVDGEPQVVEFRDRGRAFRSRLVPERDASGRVTSLLGVTEDVTDRDALEEALRLSEARFRALADSMAQLAWVAGPDGYIGWYNRRWYEYTGTTPEQMEGWGWQAVHDPATLPEVMRRWKEAIALGHPFEMEFPLRAADGRYRRFLTRAFPLRSDGGQVVQWFGTNTDVTELVEAHEALREAQRRKDEFLAVLSHEIRNPLAPIRNSVALLRRAEPGSGEAYRAIDVIDRQTTQLARLIEDLLDLTRITQGKVRLNREPASLPEVVRRTVDDHRVLFERKKVVVDYRDPGEPLWVEVDVVRLVQVVGNLLQNAAKFTSRGGHVTVSLSRSGAHAAVSVRDDGAGIDAETLDRLFEPFVQADRTLDRTLGGLGLGLALARSLVELHGGAVEAKSPGVGHGAEFVVKLPVVPAPRREPPAAQPERARVRRRVLVIEDNLDGAATLRDLLELEGHEVAVAHDGRSGVEAALAADPDVVLCDLGIPALDGYEVARRLRAQGARARLVAFTGYATAEDVDRARAAGFDDHLTKPPDLAKLFATVAAGRAR